jgi:ribosomal protein L37E
MKRKIIKGKCANCGEHLVIPTWKYCDKCTYPNTVKNTVRSVSGIPNYKVANVKWLLLRSFKGAYANDAFWVDLYEIIALDDDNNEIERIEIYDYPMCWNYIRELQKLYGAKLI